MVTRQTSKLVDVQGRDDFEELLRSFGSGPNSTVTVDVGAEVDVLNTPDEFADLVDAAYSAGTQLELATDDPVRQELARIFGVRVATGPASDPTAMYRDLATVRLETAGPQKPRQREPAQLTETREFEEVVEQKDRHAGPAFSSSKRSPFDTDASFSFVVDPPAKKSTPHSSRQPSRFKTARRPHPVSRSLRWGSVVVSGVVIVAAIAILLIALLAPSAHVVIVPETRPLSADVAYGIGAAGDALDIQVAPTVLNETITFEATVAASGEMQVPDGPARGMLFVTNPFSFPTELPAGTIFANSEISSSYISTEPIDIPAADPFGSAQFGTAVVKIEATEPGPAANLESGELTGALDSGILFQNRFPIEGGSTRTVSVVTEADMAGLAGTARADLMDRAGNLLDNKLPNGWVFVDPPGIAGDIKLDYSGQAGDVVDQIRLMASADVEGQAYDPVELEDRATDYLLESLASQIPEGFGLVMDSIRTTAPNRFEGASPVAYVVSAEALAEAQFEQEFDTALAEDLVGEDEDDAVRTLEGLQNVNSYSLTFGPDWLPWKPIPRFSERISIDIDGS